MLYPMNHNALQRTDAFMSCHSVIGWIPIKCAFNLSAFLQRRYELWFSVLKARIIARGYDSRLFLVAFEI